RGYRTRERVSRHGATASGSERKGFIPVQAERAKHSDRPGLSCFIVRKIHHTSRCPGISYPHYPIHALLVLSHGQRHNLLRNRKPCLRCNYRCATPSDELRARSAASAPGRKTVGALSPH